MRMKDKVVLVTGGAAGIGKATALRFAEEGAKVVICDVNEEAGQATAKEIDGVFYKVNVADRAEVQTWVEAVVAEYGRIDVIVNNAGILRDGMLVKVKDGEVVDRMSLDLWQSVIDVNLTGVFLCGREAAERMIVSGQQGVIINISSISRAGNTGQSNYAAAKAGVVALSTTWAKELARYGIRSASIAPGVFETEMVASMKPEAKARFVGMIPAKRTGAVEELAAAVNFIIKNDYYTGRVMELDGGLRI